MKKNEIKENWKAGQGNNPYLLAGYFHTDRRKVMPLLKYLDAAEGGSFWMKYDEFILRLPMEVDDQKRREIEMAHAVLVFVSSQFKFNEYFEQFMKWTKFYNKRVVIAYLEETALPSVLRLPKESYHHMWYLNTRPETQEQFAEELLRLAELRECLVAEPVWEIPMERLQAHRCLMPQVLDGAMVVETDNFLEKADLSFANASEFSAAQSGDPPKVWQEPEDYSRLKKRLLESTLNGDRDAMLSLGVFLKEGRNGIPVNLEEAFTWFQKAAERKNPRAWYYLGAAYEHGDGTKRDVVKALACYKEGSAQKNFRSQQAYRALCRSQSSAGN